MSDHSPLGTESEPQVFHRPQVVSEKTFKEAVRISAETTIDLSRDRRLTSEEVSIIVKQAKHIARFKQARARE